MRKSKGLSLVEFLILLVVLSASIVPLLSAYASLQQQNAENMPVSIATHLATKVMEQVERTTFASIVTQGSTAFADPFDHYFYSITAHYVQPADLNTSVDPTTTNYKNVTVTVTNDEIPGINISLVILVTSAGG